MADGVRKLFAKLIAARSLAFAGGSGIDMLLVSVTSGSTTTFGIGTVRLRG